MKTIELSVRGMASRHDVRVVCARLCDVAGVVALEVDLDASRVRVQGTAALRDLCRAIAEAGYEVLGV